MGRGWFLVGLVAVVGALSLAAFLFRYQMPHSAGGYGYLMDRWTGRVFFCTPQSCDEVLKVEAWGRGDQVVEPTK